MVKEMWQKKGRKGEVKEIGERMDHSSMPSTRRAGWKPELKGNHYPSWEEVYIFFSAETVGKM